MCDLDYYRNHYEMEYQERCRLEKEIEQLYLIISIKDDMINAFRLKIDALRDTNTQLNEELHELRKKDQKTINEYLNFKEGCR